MVRLGPRVIIVCEEGVFGISLWNVSHVLCYMFEVIADCIMVIGSSKCDPVAAFFVS